MMLSPLVRYLTRYVALAYVLVLVIVPVGLILWRTFAPGVGAFFSSITTPAAVSALQLSLLVVAIVVPLNVVFGVPTALVLARNKFRGKSVLQAVIDLPFAVSPVVVGVALILLWGTAGALGFVENSLGFKIIFGLPGIVLASIFVTVPFVIREVEPVLHELGTDQEEAASTLGAQWWQTFWRITLPSIRWGLTYGIVLTIARTLGEFGAVAFDDQSGRVRHRLRELRREQRLLAAEREAVLEMADDLIEHGERADAPADLRHRMAHEARGIAFDQKYFGAFGGVHRTIGQFARQAQFARGGLAF